MQSSPIVTEEHIEGITLMRDGEMMLTPKRNPLALPNQLLAEAIAEEFRLAALASEQQTTAEEKAKPTPARNLTKLAYTTIDNVEDAREIIIESMLAYLHTDTICYISEDPELSQFERKHWQPIIDWAEETFICQLEIYEGVMPGEQSEETAERIEEHMRDYNNWQLTALMDLGSNLSSVLLALAVLEKRLSAEQAFECAMADEIFQNEKWGKDEAAEDRRARTKADILDTERFLGLLN